LRIDAASAEVLRAFEVARIGCLLLKGPALADWYRDDPTRAYLDCDLWVRPADLPRAAERMESLGFRRLVDERGLPEWWLEHASTWWRDADGVAVDLHRRLQGAGADPETVWEHLAAAPEAVAVAGYQAPIPSTPARALYITLHAAHHGRAFGKALFHLERALSAVPLEAWRKAATLAQEVDATDAFGAGLRLIPEGAELADRLWLPATRSVKTALHAASSPPVALGFEQVASARGMLGRLRVIARKLFPPPGFIRHWWPPAARDRRMLVVGYLYRPVWLLRYAPRGFRTWREARREVRDRE
jgi:hypothetical protein